MVVLFQLQRCLYGEYDLFVLREAGIVLIGNQRFGQEKRLCPGGFVR